MFNADPGRSRRMLYRRMGTTGIMVSVISLGLKHNFNTPTEFKSCRELVLTAFNNGINYFDLAGNFGEPAGMTEELFGKIMADDLMPYRDEIVISTKVGGKSTSDAPMSEGGSRKLILTQIDKSLARLKVPYVDILFHENYDHDINPEETALALAEVVKQGKALYIGLTNYTSLEVRRMADLLRKLDVPFIGGQVRYSYLIRDPEDDGVIDTLYDFGGGTMAYQCLAQGLLTNKYIGQDIPEVCRATKDFIPTLNKEDITEELRGTLTKLNIVAAQRAQSIGQMSLAWVLRNQKIATAIIGVCKIPQLAENIGVLKKLGFTPDELKRLGDEPQVKGKKR